MARYLFSGLAMDRFEYVRGSNRSFTSAGEYRCITGSSVEKLSRAGFETSIAFRYYRIIAYGPFIVSLQKPA